MAEHAESLCYSSKYHSKITAGQRLRPMEAIARQETWRDTAARIVSRQLEMCLCTYVNIGTRGSVVPRDVAFPRNPESALPAGGSHHGAGQV